MAGGIGETAIEVSPKGFFKMDEYKENVVISKRKKQCWMRNYASFRMLQAF